MIDGRLLMELIDLMYILRVDCIARADHLRGDTEYLGKQDTLAEEGVENVVLPCSKSRKGLGLFDLIRNIPSQNK